ncbi:MAG: outer membrane protein transport protein [Bacteroidetes bacterium]|nr:outer membrane protein transport protein [Bacteroidota bacterium]
MRNAFSKTFLSGVMLLLCLIGDAQNETDVTRFITTDFGGTARFNAMGGAMGALGGDPSTLFTNPAGMGVYRSGEFSISPTFVPMRSDALMYGRLSNQNEFNFNLNNLAYINVYPFENKGRWKMGQLGFSYAQIKNLNGDYVVSGEHSDGSLSHEIAQDAFGMLPADFEFDEPFYVSPAYQTFLINPDTTTSELDYISAIPDGTRIDQLSVLSRRGRVGETTVGGSLNYDDKLYLGMGIGFTRIVYDEYLDYQEVILDTALTDLNAFSMIQDVEMRGTGLNFRFGAIYRPVDKIRIAGSYTTPTWTSMTTAWTTSISTFFDDGERYTWNADANGYNEFNMTSPSRLMGAIGLVLSKSVLLNAEYEYVDYAGAKLRSSNQTPIDFGASNSALQSELISVGNLRAGVEYRYGTLSLRGGYAFFPSPYQEGRVINNNDRTVLSGGLGYRKDKTSVDLAYRRTSFGTDFYAYAPESLQVAQIDEVQNSIILSLGFRF